MKTLSNSQISFVSGGKDWNGVPVAITTGLLAASTRWYQGDGVFSTAAFICGGAGAVLGAVGYYGFKSVLDYAHSASQSSSGL